MFASEVKLVGNHPKFIKAMELAKNVAVTKSPLLIVGESGSGKKSICRFVHQNSARGTKQILFVDCAQDPQSVENEILGFRDEETGSFNKGILERANGGSVIFANIDALEETFQKRLFQILQELSDYDLDVRVMATTTKNLSKYVGAGRFHRALYTYIASSQVSLTPLRERGSDVELIAKSFLTDYMSDNNVELSIADEALDKITTYYWTHNVKELRGMIESAAQNANGGVIDLNAIEVGEKKNDVAQSEVDEDGLRLMSLKEAEKLLIKKALIHTSENRTQAAKILGVSIRTLRNKINEYRGDGNNYFVNLR